jgi:hypothetical protein
MTKLPYGGRINTWRHSSKFSHPGFVNPWLRMSALQRLSMAQYVSAITAFRGSVCQRYNDFPWLSMSVLQRLSLSAFNKEIHKTKKKIISTSQRTEKLKNQLRQWKWYLGLKHKYKCLNTKYFNCRR